jgi:hypothetical protein
MKQPEYSPLEALERIKLMMKYDMNKTLNENKQIIFEQTNDCGPNVISDIDLIDIVDSVWESLEQLTTMVIRVFQTDSNAEEVYNNINMLVGKNVFDKDINQCVSAIDKFKTLYGTKSEGEKFIGGKDNVIEKINEALETSQVKTHLKAQNYLKSAKSLLQTTQKSITPIKQTKDNTKKSSPTKTTTVKYKPCSGTYTQGCYSDAIKQVQGCLGGLVTDGKFGPKTSEKLKTVGLYGGFSDNDVKVICDKVKPEVSGEEIEINPNEY